MSSSKASKEHSSEKDRSKSRSESSRKPTEPNPKRSIAKTKKKARTQAEISSPSASDTESSSDSTSLRTKPAKAGDERETPTSVPGDAEMGSDVAPERTEKELEDLFATYYLTRLATEFAEDLDKIRGGRDFKDQMSLEILLQALRRGGGCVPREQRLDIARSLKSEG